MIRRFVRMRAGSRSPHRKWLRYCAICWTTFSGQCEWRPRALSGSWDVTRFARSSAAIFARNPSAQIIDALAPIADEECVILLGRVARTVPDLSSAAFDALDAIDHPRALRILAEIGVPSSNG
jgi:hypothetical protein